MIFNFNTDRISVYDVIKRKKENKEIIFELYDDSFKQEELSLDEKSFLIEKILIGFPLEPIYLYLKNNGKLVFLNNFNIVKLFDEFYNNEFKLQNLTILPELNSCCFCDLNRALQSKIERYELLFFVLKSSEHALEYFKMMRK